MGKKTDRNILDWDILSNRPSTNLFSTLHCSLQKGKKCIDRCNMPLFIWAFIWFWFGKKVRCLLFFIYPIFSLKYDEIWCRRIKVLIYCSGGVAHRRHILLIKYIYFSIYYVNIECDAVITSSFVSGDHCFCFMIYISYDG